jgi:hypothetical protein
VTWVPARGPAPDADRLIAEGVAGLHDPPDGTDLKVLALDVQARALLSIAISLRPAADATAECPFCAQAHGYLDTAAPIVPREPGETVTGRLRRLWGER